MAEDAQADQTVPALADAPDIPAPPATITVTAKALVQIKTGKINENTTCNIGFIQGGRALNIVPDLCAVKGEIRSYSNSEIFKLLNEIIEISPSSKRKWCKIGS